MYFLPVNFACLFFYHCKKLLCLSLGEEKPTEKSWACASGIFFGWTDSSSYQPIRQVKILNICHPWPALVCTHRPSAPREMPQEAGRGVAQTASPRSWAVWEPSCSSPCWGPCNGAVPDLKHAQHHMCEWMRSTGKAAHGLSGFSCWDNKEFDWLTQCSKDSRTFQCMNAWTNQQGRLKRSNFLQHSRILERRNSELLDHVPKPIPSVKTIPSWKRGQLPTMCTKVPGATDRGCQPEPQRKSLTLEYVDIKYPEDQWVVQQRPPEMGGGGVYIWYNDEIAQISITTGKYSTNFKAEAEADVPMQHTHHDCRTSTAALSTTWYYEAGHMAGTNASEGQALWQPGGAEEDGRLREGNRHLHLVHEEEEEEDWLTGWPTDWLTDWLSD